MVDPQEKGMLSYSVNIIILFVNCMVEKDTPFTNPSSCIHDNRDVVQSIQPPVQATTLW